MKVCIINYNTTELVSAAIKSLRKQGYDGRVTVFDNSDRTPFNRRLKNVTRINNCQGQIIDFAQWLDTFPNKAPSLDNNYGSAKHCYTVQWLADHSDEPFILMDSDVLITQPINSFWDETKVFVGQVRLHHSRFGHIERVQPHLCYLNVPMMRDHDIHYFNPQRMFALSLRSPANAYDTGCWFLEDVRNHNLPFTDIPIAPYIRHFGHGSWRDKDATNWLSLNSELWK